ncbi:MAG: hypothetical protein KBB39_11500 [Phycicoccus sp.]|nr:hypothetical protein [Phycicoccus sp.]
MRPRRPDHRLRVRLTDGPVVGIALRPSRVDDLAGPAPLIMGWDAVLTHTQPGGTHN